MASSSSRQYQRRRGGSGVYAAAPPQSLPRVHSRSRPVDFDRFGRAVGWKAPGTGPSRLRGRSRPRAGPGQAPRHAPSSRAVRSGLALCSRGRSGRRGPRTAGRRSSAACRVLSLSIPVASSIGREAPVTRLPGHPLTRYKAGLSRRGGVSRAAVGGRVATVLCGVGGPRAGSPWTRRCAGRDHSAAGEGVNRTSAGEANRRRDCGPSGSRTGRA